MIAAFARPLAGDLELLRLGGGDRTLCEALHQILRTGSGGDDVDREDADAVALCHLVCVRHRVVELVVIKQEVLVLSRRRPDRACCHPHCDVPTTDRATPV